MLFEPGVASVMYSNLQLVRLGNMGDVYITFRVRNLSDAFVNNTTFNGDSLTREWNIPPTPDVVGDFTIKINWYDSDTNLLSTTTHTSSVAITSPLVIPSRDMSSPE